jgi:phage baseplate assembly protein W
MPSIAPRNNILGSTIKYPFTIGGTDVVTVNGIEALQSRIQVLFNTVPYNRNTRIGGERVYKRHVGINLSQFVFDNDSPSLRSLIALEILSLSKFEPNIFISPSDVFISGSSHNSGYKYNVRIGYTLLSNGTKDTLIIDIIPIGF